MECYSGVDEECDDEEQCHRYCQGCRDDNFAVHQSGSSRLARRSTFEARRRAADNCGTQSKAATYPESLTNGHLPISARHKSVIERTPINGCNAFLILPRLSDDPQQAVRFSVLDWPHLRHRLHRGYARRFVQLPQLIGSPHAGAANRILP